MRPRPRLALLVVALLVVALAGRAAPAQVCTVRTSHPLQIAIEPTTEHPELYVQTCPAPVVITVVDRMPMPVEATAPLAFRGLSDLDEGRISNARPLALVGDMVHLAAHSALHLRRVDGDSALMDVPTDHGTIVDLSVRCDALALSFASTPGRLGPRAERPDGTRWRPPSLFVVFRERPNAGRSVVITGGVAFERVERAGPWWRMMLDDPFAGVRLVGWVPRVALQPFVGDVMGNISTEGHGSGEGGGSEDFEPGDYFGAARLAEGAVVYAERGSGPWATAHAPATARVLIRRGARWAEVFDVWRGNAPRPVATSAHLALPERHAFVRVEDVHPLAPTPTERHQEMLWSDWCLH